MNRFSEDALTNLALLLLRIGFGIFMIIGHGWRKLLKVFEGDMEFGDPLGIGPTPSLILTVFAEVLCSVLLIIGFKTRWALIPLIITMAVAFFLVHLNDPFGRQEKALMYLVGYLAMLLMGPGKYSIDYMIKKA